MSEEMKLQLERDRKELEASRSVNPVKDSKTNKDLNKSPRALNCHRVTFRGYV